MQHGTQREIRLRVGSRWRGGEGRGKGVVAATTQAARAMALPSVLLPHVASCKAVVVIVIVVVIAAAAVVVVVAPRVVAVVAHCA